MTFDSRYVDHVLEEHFEGAKALCLSPLMAIHRLVGAHAHLRQRAHAL